MLRSIRTQSFDHAYNGENQVEMTAGIMVLLADLWAITRTLRSDAEPKNKVKWVAIVLLLPFVGMVLWILFGPS